MTGLFAKDIQLILSRKSSIAIFLMIGIIMAFQGGSSMAFVYLTIFGTVLALGTLSYDDADNCMPFLMTLPYSRREYIYEKYLFVLCCALISSAAGAVIFAAYSLITHTPITLNAFLEAFLAFIPAVLLVISLMIPLQLRFGAEKMRIVMLVVYGVVLIGCMAVGSELEAVSNMLSFLNPVLVCAAVLIVCILISAGSVMVSVRILENKEF